MRLPIIGITTNNDVTPQGYPAVVIQRAYSNAIINANGIPILIPSSLCDAALKEILPKLDGILFSGGGDISVEYYGGQDHPLIANLDIERDILEMSLMKAAIDLEKPFLGICRGLQVLNVLLGGTLYSDIGSQKNNLLKHDYYPNYSRNFLAHKVEISSANRLSNIFGLSGFEVNSLHHQGVHNLANGLKVIGVAPDGMIEALELPGHIFGIAVQWHPECLTEQSSMKQLFIEFTKAARDSIRI